MRAKVVAFMASGADSRPTTPPRPAAKTGDEAAISRHALANAETRCVLSVSATAQTAKAGRREATTSPAAPSTVGSAQRRQEQRRPFTKVALTGATRAAGAGGAAAVRV